MTRTNQNSTDPAGRLTVETACWILIVIVALALRLARLDAAPLSVHEAREAMLAWRAVTGQGMPEAGYSPFLFAANALLFSLCGASDSLARLWPALCGSVLALTPLLLRRRIGQMGALAAGTYMAFSPTLLFASRQLDGAAVAALGGMTFLGGLARFCETGERPWLTLSVGGLALAVTSSSSAYGLLLTLGLAWMGLAWVWPDRGARWLWTLLDAHSQHMLLVFAFAVLLLPTALGWNLAGLGAVGDLLPAWMSRFGPSLDAAVSPMMMLVVYELLALLFGLGGLVWSIWRGHRFGILLGVWAGVAMVLLILMSGRLAFDILWVLLPLILLAGVAVEQLARDLQERGDWRSEGLHVPVVVLLWVHLYLRLAGYADSGDVVDLALALLTLALQGLLAMVFALAIKFDAALRAVAVGTGSVLLALLLSAGWGGAHVRPTDPRELLARDPTASEVRDLTETLRDLSWRRTGFPLTLPLVLEAEADSVLAWYLRDFTAVRRVESLEAGGVEGETDLVLVSTQSSPDEDEVRWWVSEGYVGQSFTLHRTWNSADIACVWEWPPQCQCAVRWWLFRSSPVTPVVDRQAVLWIRKVTQ
jgi:uncharacterized protein (TIGR03663 family)